MSSVDSPTEKLSQLIDIVLATSDFLTKIKGIKLEEDEWMFSLDVTSLYINIPHDEGIRVVETVLSDYDGLPTKDSVIKMLNLVLKCNCFRFNNDYFLQTNGTAIRTRFAPTYAIIFMNDFQERVVYKYHHPPKIWFQFIDDIWGIFKGSLGQLMAFLEHLNSAHDTIKFTMSYSRTEIVFLGRSN